MPDLLSFALPELLLARDGAVLTITFNRPESRNALTLPMYDALENIMLAAARDRSLRVIVITGAGGKAFASGTDAAELRKITGPQDALAYEGRGARLVQAIEACGVPCIAAIDGACVGGGVAIAAACDLRIATEHSVFGLPMARTMGNCLSLASCRLLGSIVGASRLKSWMFTAELWPAGRAERYGLLDTVVADAAELSTVVGELAARIETHAPLTLRATKQMIRLMREGGDESAERDIIAEVYGSADFLEGLTAFADKRKPVWTGE
ncbi:MAG: enoyl-CoA hydratase [Pigmentiphaga sp.]